jgi:hypothetical protein
LLKKGFDLADNPRSGVQVTLPAPDKSRIQLDPAFQFVKKPFAKGKTERDRGGGARGGKARLELDRMPRNVLQGKTCGARSADFCAAAWRKSNGIFLGCLPSGRGNEKNLEKISENS